MEQGTGAVVSLFLAASCFTEPGWPPGGEDSSGDEGSAGGELGSGSSNAADSSSGSTGSGDGEDGSSSSFNSSTDSSSSTGSNSSSSGESSGSASSGGAADPYGDCAACDGLCIDTPNGIAEVCAPFCDGDGAVCPGYGSCEYTGNAGNEWVCMLLCASDPEATMMTCPDGMTCGGWNDSIGARQPTLSHVICWWYD